MTSCSVPGCLVQVGEDCSVVREGMTGVASEGDFGQENQNAESQN